MPTTAAELAAAFRDGLPLTTGRLVLRAPTMADAPRISGLAGDWEIAKFTAAIPHPYSDDDAERWVRGASTALRTPSGAVAMAVAVKPDPKLAGIVSLSLDRDHHSAEVGFWIGRPYWGQGYITEAVARLCAFVRQRLALAELHAAVMPENKGSARVLAKLGFRYDDMVRREMPARGSNAMLERHILLFDGGVTAATVGLMRDSRLGEGRLPAGPPSERPDQPTGSRISASGGSGMSVSPLSAAAPAGGLSADPPSGTTPAAEGGVRPAAGKKRRLLPVKQEVDGVMSVADLMAGGGGFTSMPASRVAPSAGGKGGSRQARPPPPRGMARGKPPAPAYDVKLVVAVALVDADGRVLMAQRPDGKPMAGLWEFPGGKVNPGETPEAALIRELKEELAIDISASCLAPLTFASHGYPDFHLLMPLYVCRVWEGEPAPVEGQTLAWVRPTSMPKLEMPEADKPLIAMLRDLL